MTATLELRHEYRSRGAAAELMKRREAEVLLSGPAGTGKSRAGLEKLMVAAVTYPGMKGLILRKVAADTKTSVLPIWDEEVIPELTAGGGVEFRGETAKEPARYLFSSGARVIVGGLDKASRVMGSAYDFIYVSEATELSLTDWQALTTRLRRGKMPYNQIVADCNPNAPTHWLKQRVDSGTTVMLESRHVDNPRYYDDAGNPTEQGKQYVETILNNLVGVDKLRLKDGLWVAAEGVIWGSFDPARHVVNRDQLPGGKVPDSWQRVWTVDFGTSHPFVLQCWAIDGDGRGWLYREIYHTKRMVEDYAKQILSIVAPDGKWTEPKPIRVVCDHQAQERLSLRKYLGINNRPADKRVKLGLDAVERRFRDNRLFILSDALVESDKSLVNAKVPYRTVMEIPSYVWDETKEQPVKVKDDGCDALRYFVADQDLKKKLTIPDDREVWL
jgi:PBSX family phage terminase large subunit